MGIAYQWVVLPLPHHPQYDRRRRQVRLGSDCSPAGYAHGHSSSVMAWVRMVLALVFKSPCPLVSRPPSCLATVALPRSHGLHLVRCLSPCCPSPHGSLRLAVSPHLTLGLSSPIVSPTSPCPNLTVSPWSPSRPPPFPSSTVTSPSDPFVSLPRLA